MKLVELLVKLHKEGAFVWPPDVEVVWQNARGVLKGKVKGAQQWVEVQEGRILPFVEDMNSTCHSSEFFTAVNYEHDKNERKTMKLIEILAKRPNIFDTDPFKSADRLVQDNSGLVCGFKGDCFFDGREWLTHNLSSDLTGVRSNFGPVAEDNKTAIVTRKDFEEYLKKNNLQDETPAVTPSLPIWLESIKGASKSNFTPHTQDKEKSRTKKYSSKPGSAIVYYKNGATFHISKLESICTISDLAAITRSYDLKGLSHTHTVYVTPEILDRIVCIDSQGEKTFTFTKDGGMFMTKLMSSHVETFVPVL